MVKKASMLNTSGLKQVRRGCSKRALTLFEWQFVDFLDDWVVSARAFSDHKERACTA